MAGLPRVMQVKLESLKAADAAEQPAPVQTKPNGATAVVSMVPNGERPRPPGSPPPPAPAALDPNDFAVDPQPAVPGGPPAAAASVPEPVPPDPAAAPAPRAGDEDLIKPREGTPEYPYWLRWKTISGMYERAKDDKRKLQESFDMLTARFDALNAKLDEIKAAPPPPAPAPVAAVPLDADLSDEERNTYKDALPVIEKMASRIVAKALEDAGVPSLKTEVGELKANTGNLSKTQATQDENAFIGRVRDKFPKMDSMVREAGWSEYMAKRVPFSPHTFGQALIAAHNARDFERVVEIMEGYQPTAKPTIDELATPSRRADTVDPVAAAQLKPTLKWSERVKAGIDFTKGRITRERLDQINALYTEAEKEGRINMNA